MFITLSHLQHPCIFDQTSKTSRCSSIYSYLKNKVSCPQIIHVRVLPADEEFDLILAHISPSALSAGRERLKDQGELYKHAALAVDIGWLSGGHLGDL